MLKFMKSSFITGEIVDLTRQKHGEDDYALVTVQETDTKGKLIPTNKTFLYAPLDVNDIDSNDALWFMKPGDRGTFETYEEKPFLCPKPHVSQRTYCVQAKHETDQWGSWKRNTLAPCTSCHRNLGIYNGLRFLEFETYKKNFEEPTGIFTFQGYYRRNTASTFPYYGECISTKTPRIHIEIWGRNDQPGKEGYYNYWPNHLTHYQLLITIPPATQQQEKIVVVDNHIITQEQLTHEHNETLQKVIATYQEKDAIYTKKLAFTPTPEGRVHTETMTVFLRHETNTGLALTKLERVIEDLENYFTKPILSPENYLRDIVQR